MKRVCSRSDRLALVNERTIVRSRGQNATSASTDNMGARNSQAARTDREADRFINPSPVASPPGPYQPERLILFISTSSAASASEARASPASTPCVVFQKALETLL